MDKPRPEFWRRVRRGSIIRMEHPASLPFQPLVGKGVKQGPCMALACHVKDDIVMRYTAAAHVTTARPTLISPSIANPTFFRPCFSPHTSQVSMAEGTCYAG